jgi:hypothetical protein
VRHDRIPRTLDDFIDYFSRRLDVLERAKRATTAGTGGAIDDSLVTPVAPNDRITSYTAVLLDSSRLVRISSASPAAFTIPPSSSVAFALGAALQVAQQGAGQITVTAGAGVTLRAPHGAKTGGQYAIAQAIKVSIDEWYLTGDTTT